MRSNSKKAKRNGLNLALLMGLAAGSVFNLQDQGSGCFSAACVVEA